MPFSTTNYTSELIENQQAQSVSDVVMNDASVRPLTARGGYGDEFQIRGFTLSNTDVSINGLYGLAPATRIPLEFIERIEVLKGPGALTNGVGPSGSVGGSINVVTKRAGDVPLTRLTTSYMGKANFGAHLDVGRRFGQDNEWGIRVNGLVRGGEGTIDGGKQNLNLGSLGLDYAGGRTRWSLDAVATDGKTENYRNQTSLANASSVPAVPDPRTAIYPGAKLKDSLKLVSSRLEQDIGDSTTLYGGIGWSQAKSAQDFPSGRPNAAGTFSITNAWYDQLLESKSADLGLRTRFATGAVKHTVALGLNYMSQDSSYYYTYSSVSTASSLYSPVAAAPLSSAHGSPLKSTENKQHSIAITDTLAFLDDRLLVTVGARRQTMDYTNYAFTYASTAANEYSTVSSSLSGNYKASSTTPLGGVVFKPTRNTSVYANYTAGLTRGSKVSETASPAYDNAGEVIPPYKSKQIEAGVKADWGRITTQAAIYQIKQPSGYSTTSTTDPSKNHYSYGGEQRNRGLELTAYGELQRGLRLMASAAFNDAKLTRQQGGANEGNKATGVPGHNYNLGLDWDTPWVPGLSLNGRVISSSAVYIDAANTLRTPGWTRLDLGARYATKLVNTPVVLRANLENVTDKAYWITGINGYSTTGLPRTLTVSAQFDF
ncbi:TonB-dependent receptor [Xylophilus sp.]|uniref:TonB-dependent receptor n=1 Tax=Xylophilus sp. TaxID=2653893 RepID=UPI002D7F62E2|nr:TonB-dependent receptor [Xylophilus sp.]